MASKQLAGTKTHTQPQGRVRRRVAGEPPLPVLRQGRRRGGAPRRGRPLQGHGGRRDRARARAPRLPQAGGRSGDRAPHRQHREEPEERRRRRDARVRDHVPGHGQGGPRGGLRRHRRVVRDPRQGREVARGPLRQGARRRSTSDTPPPGSPSRPLACGRGGEADARLLEERSRERDRPSAGRAAGPQSPRPALLRAARPGGGAPPHLPDLPRVPHVRGLLRLVPDAVQGASTATSRPARPRAPRSSPRPTSRPSAISAGSASSATSSAPTPRTRPPRSCSTSPG